MAIPVHQQQSCDVMFMFGCHRMVRRKTKQPNLTAMIQSQRSCPIWARWTCGWWHRCEDDPKSSPSRELEETTGASPYGMAEHRQVRSESLQPHTERSSRPGSEPPSVEADVYVWCYVLLDSSGAGQKRRRRMPPHGCHQPVGRRLTDVWYVANHIVGKHDAFCLLFLH